MDIALVGSVGLHTTIVNTFEILISLNTLYSKQPRKIRPATCLSVVCVRVMVNPLLAIAFCLSDVAQGTPARRLTSDIDPAAIGPVHYHHHHTLCSMGDVWPNVRRKLHHHGAVLVKLHPNRTIKCPLVACV